MNLFFADLFRAMQRSGCFVILILCLGLSSRAQQVILFPQMDSLLQESGKEILVVNFWATWCKPCVAELPSFDSLAASGRDDLRFLFISLDFKSQLKSKLVPFLEQRKFPGPVFLLNEPDYNSWINRVDPRWQGSIPATLVLNKMTGKRVFHEGSVTSAELLLLINQTL